MYSDSIDNRIYELPRIISNRFESEGSKYYRLMPRDIDDPSLDDNVIADLVFYISSIFSEESGEVRRDDVMMIRKELKLANYLIFEMWLNIVSHLSSKSIFRISFFYQ